MSKLIKRIFDVIFITIILILVSYFVLRINKKIEIYNVRTGSMEDNIHAGDYVLIVKKSNYEIGDVVTFRKDGYLVTHRIIKKNGSMFVTKGDANNDEDGPIYFSQIVGKVIIIGGILNFVITFKYFLASAFISLYLVSCYFLEKEEKKELLEKEKAIDKKEKKKEEPIFEDIKEEKIIPKKEEKKETPKKEVIEESIFEDLKEEKIVKETKKEEKTKEEPIFEEVKEILPKTEPKKKVTKKTETPKKENNKETKTTTKKKTSSKKKTNKKTTNNKVKENNTKPVTDNNNQVTVKKKRKKRKKKKSVDVVNK